MKKFSVIFLIMMVAFFFVSLLLFSLVADVSEKKRATPRLAVRTDFMEEGNLVPVGDGWNIVYEKPGAPALVSMLVFSDESVCGDGRCGRTPLAAGDRVSIRGIKMEEEKVLVVRLDFSD